MDIILERLGHARTYPYRGKTNLFTTVEQEGTQRNTPGINEYVLFSHVDDRVFAGLSREDIDQHDDYEDYENVDEKNYGARNSHDIIPTLIKVYSRLDNLLVIKMTASESQEQLHASLAQLIADGVKDMGLGKQLKQIGRTSVETCSRVKSPDAAFKPRKLPNGRSDKWPTIAIEVGCAESLARLQADAGFWITESGVDVKIVLIATVNRTRREIILQKWEPDSRNQGQTMTDLT